MSRELFLYTRENCHLCEQMQQDLQNLLAGENITVHVVDIAGDDELEHRYGARIPVLSSGRSEICELQLDMAAIGDFLAGEAGRAPA